MQNAVYCLYKSHRVVNPKQPRIKTIHFCLYTLRTLLRERYDTASFLLNDNKYYSEIRNKEIVDAIYKKSGAVFITIHSNTYTLLGKIFSDHFRQRKLVVPYKAKVFRFLSKKLKKEGVIVTPLGGAMSAIQPALSNGGSVLLYLDTNLPVKHKAKVTLFGRNVELTTGPLWLAKKYNLPIVPLYIGREGKKMTVDVFQPIKYRGKKDSLVMQEISFALENLILKNLKSWHVYDAFLLGEEEKFDMKQMVRKSVLYPLKITPSLQKLVYLIVAFLGKAGH